MDRELKFRELKGKTGLDFYFSIIDEAPSIKAGEYEYMTQGGNNEKDSVDIPIAREIIANVVQKKRSSRTASKMFLADL